MVKIEYKNHIISTIDEWRNLIFNGKKKIHWKKGRSAYSIADFIINRNGIGELNKLVSNVLGENTSFDKIQPEYEANFDNLGHGREHDLAIWGKSESGKRIFVGVEAKVDESYGDTISSAYLKKQR